MMADRRLIQDPLWARNLGPLPSVREVANRSRRRLSLILDISTERVARAIAVTEAILRKAVKRIGPIARRPHEQVAIADSVVSAAPRKWRFEVSDRLLTVAIACAAVVLALMALRTIQLISVELIEFLAQTVNGFFDRLGYPTPM